jgi:cell division septum initiation protein DivIVA
MHGPAGRAVTTNLDALLLENEALRHQVRLLREELTLLQSSRSAEAQAQAQTQAAADFAGRPHPRQGVRAWRDDQEAPRPQPTPEPGWRQAAPRGERVRSWRSGPKVTVGAAPGITPQLVRQWAEALSSHPRWRELRLGSRLEGDPAAGGSVELGLQALLDDLRSRSHNPALELEDALDRRAPGLGAELRWALAGPASRAKAAVRAAFALDGPRAADRLSADPQAVVEELLAAIARLEVQVLQEAQARREQAERQQAWWRQQDGRRPGGRSWGAAGAHADGRAGAREAGSDGPRDAGSSRAWGAGAGDSRGSEQGRQVAPDRQRVEALGILELSWGAPVAAVKAAHRRLVKRHHPDMGGDAESFRRINDAYQLLMA